MSEIVCTLTDYSVGASAAMPANPSIGLLIDKHLIPILDVVSLLERSV